MGMAVNRELVERLTERAAAEMGEEVASLIPLIVADVVKEASELGGFRRKTVKIPLTVDIETSCRGRVFIGECSWDFRARRSQPGFPPVEVDLGQMELDFAASAEEPGEEPQDEPDGSPCHGGGGTAAPDLWAALEVYATRHMCKVLRPAAMEERPEAGHSYIEVFSPYSLRWERFCMGSAQAVDKAESYADSPAAKSLVVHAGDWNARQGQNGASPRPVASLSEESVRKILKEGEEVRDFLQAPDPSQAAVFVDFWIGAGGEVRCCRTTLPAPRDISEEWRQALPCGILPMALPWPPPAGHKVEN